MGLAKNFLQKFKEENLNPLQMTTYKGDMDWINKKLVPQLTKAKINQVDLMSLEKHKGLVSIEVKSDKKDLVKDTFVNAGIKDVEVVKGSKSWTSKIVGKYPH